MFYFLNKTVSTHPLDSPPHLAFDARDLSTNGALVLVLKVRAHASAHVTRGRRPRQRPFLALATVRVPFPLVFHLLETIAAHVVSAVCAGPCDAEQFGAGRTLPLPVHFYLSSVLPQNKSVHTPLAQKHPVLQSVLPLVLGGASPAGPGPAVLALVERGVGEAAVAAGALFADSAFFRHVF